MGFLMTLGCLVHITLDMYYRPGVILLWPIDIWISFYGIIQASYFEMATNPVQLATFADSMRNDMILGTLWVMWLYWKKNIKF